MKVGHATGQLTVPRGTPMGGYTAREALSHDVLDPLEVACISITSARRRLLLVVAELACVNTDLATQVRRRVVRELDADGITSEVWTCATHTHSGPDVGCQPGGGPTPPEWRDAVATTAAHAARRAVEGERECAGTYRSGLLDTVGSHRNADGPARVPVDILTFGDDTVLGVLVVVPIHPTVLPASSAVVSGDLHSWIRQALRVRLTTGTRAPWVVVATGAAGDISTRRIRMEQTADEGHRLAAVAADRIVELLRDEPAIPWTADDGLTTTRRSLKLPVRDDDESHLRDIAERLTTRLADSSLDGESTRSVVTARQGVHAAIRRAGEPGFPTRLVAELSAARLGALNILGVGGEPFLSMRSTAAAGINGPTVLLGYSNGYVGYIPETGAFDETSYEALISPLEAGCADVVVDALHQLFIEPTPGGTTP